MSVDICEEVHLELSPWQTAKSEEALGETDVFG